MCWFLQKLHLLFTNRTFCRWNGIVTRNFESVTATCTSAFRIVFVCLTHYQLLTRPLVIAACSEYLSQSFSQNVWKINNKLLNRWHYCYCPYSERMGKVLFSQVADCSGGGVFTPSPSHNTYIHWSHVPSCGLLHPVSMGVPPASLDEGYPSHVSMTPPPPPKLGDRAERVLATRRSHRRTCLLINCY